MSDDDVTTEFLAIVRRSYKSQRAVDASTIRAYRDYVINGILDLEMHVGAAARERTAAQYSRLLSRAGFRMARVVETVSPYSIVEAVAAKAEGCEVLGISLVTNLAAGLAESLDHRECRAQPLR